MSEINFRSLNPIPCIPDLKRALCRWPRIGQHTEVSETITAPRQDMRRNSGASRAGYGLDPRSGEE